MVWTETPSPSDSWTECPDPSLGGVLGDFVEDDDGLIFRDQFDRADDPSVGNGWTEIGATGLLSLTDNQLKKTSGNGAGVRQSSSLTPSQDVIIQTNFRAGSDRHGSFLLAKSDVITSINDAYVFRADDDGFGSDTVWTIRRVKGGTQTILASQNNNPAIGNGAVYGHRGIVAGTTLKQLHSSITELDDIVTDFSLVQSVVDGNPPVNFGDFIGASIAVSVGNADEFFICGRNITVTGMPTGWKVQVDARAAVVESGGTAVVDVDTWALPLTEIKILDDNDVERNSDTPVGGLWGGATYTFTQGSADWTQCGDPSSSWTQSPSP